MNATFNFLCLDCQHDTFRNEYYSLHDEIWLAANRKGSGMRCIGCVEKRLKRRFRPADFIDTTIKNPADPLRPKSARLLSRILGIDEEWPDIFDNISQLEAADVLPDEEGWV